MESTLAKKDFEVFGKHILLERIAMGGMAEIFLARSNGTGGISKFSAIKRILPQYSSNTEFISMFKDEAKINVNLSHSNIVPIYEFGVESGQFYILMEFVNGKNLRQILTRMQKESDVYFSIDQIINIVKDVAAGLDHAHRCLDGTTGKPLNIIHRDMSPQNIMISFEGEVKVVDFGIAKAESQAESTKAGTLKGKFAYMSPEQATGESIDLRTDIFSLGIVLWELLAKERLFVAENEIGTLKKIREGKIPSIRKLNPNVPEELERIVNKSLAKSTSERYQTCADFQRDLSKFLNTHYPDFSSHDFSIFIKSLYADEILQNRKKLIEYSSIKFESKSDQSEVEKTIVGVTKTDIDFDDLGFEDDKKNSLFDIENSQKSNFDIKSITLSKDRSKPSSSGNNRQNQRSISVNNYQRPRPKKSFDITNYTKYFVFFLIAAGLALVASQLFPNQSSQDLASMNDALPETLRSRINEKYLTIESTPPGAMIFINAIYTGQLTPARVKVPSAEDFILTIKKQNHIDFESKIDSQFNKPSYSAVLQKVQIGYIDIDVSPKGLAGDVVLYIDGTAMNNTPLPIYGYKVLADKQIEIRATNRRTRKFDVKVLTLKSGEKQSVLLTPNKIIK